MIVTNSLTHAQDFVPITRRCLRGRDAVAATLDSFFDQGNVRCISDDYIVMATNALTHHL